MSANSGRLFNSVVCEEEPVRSPLGYTRSGQPVWPIYGAEPDDDDDDSDDDDDDDEDDTAAGKSKDKDAKDKAGNDDDDDELTAAEARAERYRRRMKAADRRAAEAERERDALKKGKEGDEDQSAVVAEKDKQIESLSGTIRELTMQNAFLLNNKFTWHDPEDVMALALKDEDLEVDEDGVHGMEAVLKKIAKKKPWLVKVDDEKSSKDDDDDEDDDDEDDTEEPAAQRRTAKSGSATAGRRKRKSEADREALLSTFPALRRR